MQRLMLTLFLLSPPAAAGRKALKVGDSWAAYAGSSLMDYCGGISEVVNRGIPGATAWQYAAQHDCSSAPPDGMCCQGSLTCSAADAVKSMSAPPTVTWVSIGGNDFINDHCHPSDMDALEQNIAKVIADVQSAAPATDIVVTGYTVPSGALAWTTGCEAVHSLRALNSAMKAAAAARNVTYVNISSLLGGTHTNWSNSSWMQDPIHLNKHGYCKLWTHSEIQKAFDCQGDVPLCDEPVSGSLGRVPDVGSGATQPISSRSWEEASADILGGGPGLVAPSLRQEQAHLMRRSKFLSKTMQNPGSLLS